MTFTVEEGATAEQVVEGLAAERVIPCGGFVGNLLMRGTGRSGEIRAGTYSLTTGMTLDEAVEVLTTPPKQIPTADVLVPPGYRVTQIADAVEESLGHPGRRVPRSRRRGEVRPPRQRSPPTRRSKGSSGPRPTASRNGTTPTP